MVYKNKQNIRNLGVYAQKRKQNASGKTQIDFFAPVNQMVHNGPNVTEWYTVLHHELKTVHNLAHEI